MKASHYEFGLGHVALVGNTLSIDLSRHQPSGQKAIWHNQYVSRDKAVLLDLIEKYYDYWLHHNYNNKEEHVNDSV